MSGASGPKSRETAVVLTSSLDTLLLVMDAVFVFIHGYMTQTAVVMLLIVGSDPSPHSVGSSVPFSGPPHVAPENRIILILAKDQRALLVNSFVRISLAQERPSSVPGPS